MSFWKKLLYRIIYPASLIFTVISLIIYAIWASEEGGNTTAVLFFVLTAYALFVAFVSCIFFTEMIMPLKIIVHFGALFLSLCIFCAVGKFSSSTVAWIIGIFTVAYIAVCVPALIVTGKKKKEKSDKKDYKNLFSK